MTPAAAIAVTLFETTRTVVNIVRVMSIAVTAVTLKMIVSVTTARAYRRLKVALNEK